MSESTKILSYFIVMIDKFSDHSYNLSGKEDTLN